MQAERLHRLEVKYWIHPMLVPQLRAAIQPWCHPDTHAHGDPPHYRNITVQLDTPDLAFYRAQREDADRRCKLRIRQHIGPEGPVPHATLEVKSKLGQIIDKRRAVLPIEALDGARLPPAIAAAAPDSGLGIFRRLLVETGARPVVAVRYRREAWMGDEEDYARVTFDTELSYLPWRRWRPPPPEGRWRPLDMPQKPGVAHAGAVLELKCTTAVPRWMVALVEHFELNRQSVCKYAIAVDRERQLLPPGAWLAA